MSCSSSDSTRQLHQNNRSGGARPTMILRASPLSAVSGRGDMTTVACRESVEAIRELSTTGQP
eukprot:6186260-Pleurochrysis_carterae.AAC.1